MKWHSVCDKRADYFWLLDWVGLGCGLLGVIVFCAIVGLMVIRVVGSAG